MPKTPIQVLIVEDSEFDARILVNTLRQGGYDPFFQRVETAESMRQALADHPWEVILSDYNLPEFSAPAALKVLQESAQDLPFLIISGGIGEDVAVACMKAGAHDYLMKGNLARLVPAVEREMREAASRRAGRIAEEALRESEQRNRLLWENSTDAVVMMKPDGTVCFANPALDGVFGYTPDYAIGKNFTQILAEEERSRFPDWVATCLQQRHASGAGQPIQSVGCHRQGRELHLDIGLTSVEFQQQIFVVAFIRDITERKRAEEESRLLQSISLAVGTAPDLNSSLSVVLHAVCQNTGWALAQAWLPSPDGSFLECSPVWFGDNDRFRPFRKASELLQLRPGEGLPGRTWQLVRPLWVDDIGAGSNAPRAQVAREVGVVAAAGVPIVSDSGVVATEILQSMRLDLGSAAAGAGFVGCGHLTG